jgi:hypothetical protein
MFYFSRILGEEGLAGGGEGRAIWVFEIIHNIKVVRVFEVQQHARFILGNYYISTSCLNSSFSREILNVIGLGCSFKSPSVFQRYAKE